MRLPALAALFFLGYLASFAHDVSVPHSVCAEHGEWIHDESSTGEVTSGHVSDDDAPKLRSSEQPTEDPHAHCGILLISRGASSPAPSTPLAISAPLLDSVCALVAYATPLRKVFDRASPTRGPPASV